MPRRAIFVDRDGTLSEKCAPAQVVDTMEDAADWALAPGVSAS